VKRLIALCADTGLCVLTVWLAFYIRLDEWVGLGGNEFFTPSWAAIASIAIAIPLFVTHGFYRVIFRHAGLSAVTSVFRAFSLYALFYATAVTAVGLPGVPRSIGLIQPMLLLLAVGGSRVLARFWLGGLYQARLARAALPRALVYGAGDAGRQLAAGMVTSHEMRVVGFIDDDERLHGHTLSGLPVYAPDDIAGLVETQSIGTVLLALPSASRQRRRAIIERIRELHVAVRTLPSIGDLAHGRVSVSDVRELDIDDLLGREPVQPAPDLLSRNVAGKVVMVTGAGGSIGSELCRQILGLCPARILLVDHSEFALYAIHEELSARKPEGVASEPPPELLPFIGSVQDARRMREIMSAWQPHTVYHAAAYKHVPLVEHNPAEGIRNNAFGTLATARAAVECGVSDFVLVSTDKAVRPTNVMGASKRLAEMILQALAAEGAATRFTMVRFGNVLGSSGSVVPLFRKQIRDGGPVTLTHLEVTRYFMTIPEAAQLVIQAGALANGGDVFVLDMGEPVRIADLARRMVELSGLSVRDVDNPEGDISIEVTGLRSGEKLYEELLIGDNPEPTTHPRIMRAREEFMAWQDMAAALHSLEGVIDAGVGVDLKPALAAVVAGYSPAYGQRDVAAPDSGVLG